MKPIGDLFEVINGVPSSNVKIFLDFAQNRVKYARPSNTYKGVFAGYIEIADVNSEKIFPEETLFVSTDGEGSHSHAYVSTESFVPNSNVAVLIPKIELSLQEKLYYAVCITLNRYKFSYGRKPKGNRLKSILIPDKFEIPDWVNSIDTHDFITVKEPFTVNSTLKLDTQNWVWFNLDSLFELKKGKRLTKANMIDGNTPFIGAIDKNNGYREYTNQKPIHFGNTITVNYNGNGVAEAFYQPKPYWCSDDVNVLYPKFNCNKYIALFICTLIRLEKYRFNYGRKWHVERMKISEIMLPVDKANKPDFAFMEKYIKTLNYSKRI